MCVGGGGKWGVGWGGRRVACAHACMSTSAHLLAIHRLVSLVVKASALRAEDSGFESRLCGDFSR